MTDNEKEIDKLTSLFIDGTSLFGRIDVKVAAQKVVYSGYRKADEVRKETAKWFAELLEQKCNEKDGYAYSLGNIKHLVNEILKQAGVEVE